MVQTADPTGPEWSDEARFNAALRRAVLRPIIAEFQRRLDDAGRDYNTITRSIEGLEAELWESIQRGASAAIQREIRQDIAKWDRRFKASMTKHFGVRVRFMDDSILEPIMQRAIIDNVSLVKTIPQRHHAGLVKEIEKLARTHPFDEYRLARVIQKNNGLTGYNLRRITRDQTSKLVGNLNQARQGQLGITEYIWSTSADEAVRATHRANEGKLFAWSSPPPNGTGHPGQDIQCRCVSRPVIPSSLPSRPSTPAAQPQRFKSGVRADSPGADLTSGNTLTDEQRQRWIQRSDEADAEYERSIRPKYDPKKRTYRIEKYSEEDYWEINEGARDAAKGEWVHDSTLEKIAETARDMASYGLMLADDLLMFRGIGKDLAGSFRVGDDFTEPGFSSMSMSPRTAASFTTDQGAFIEIVGIQLCGLAAGNFAEAELVAMPGVRYEVLSVENDVEIPGPGGSTRKVRYVRAMLHCRKRDDHGDD